MTAQLPERDLLSVALDTDDPSKILTESSGTLREKPDDALVLAAQGVAQKRSGDEAPAIDSLLKALDAGHADLALYPRIHHAVYQLGLPDAFLQALESRVKGPDAQALHWLVLGRFQFFLNRNAEAVVSLTEVARLEPSVDYILYELARAAMDAGNPGVVLNALDRLEGLNEVNVPALWRARLRILALCQEKRSQEALTVWRSNALPLNEADGQSCGILLAETLLADAPPRVEEAIEIAGEVARHQRPEDRWSARRTEVQALVMLRKFDDALALLETAETDDVKSQQVAAIRFWQASILELLSRFDEALARIEEGVANPLAPSDLPIIHSLHARLLNHKGQFQKAIDSLSGIDISALDAELRGPISLTQGVAFAGLSQNDRALPKLEEARRTIQDPSVLDIVLFHLGSVLNALNRFEDALITFGEVLRREPANVTGRLSALLGQSVALHRLGRIPEAIEKLDQAIPLAPASDRAGRAGLYYRRALVAQSGGTAGVSEAMKSVGLLLETIGDDQSLGDLRVRALGIRAWASGIQRNHAEALEVIDQMIALRPSLLREDLEFIIFRWEVLIQLARYPDALSMIENTIDSTSPLSSHPWLRIHRAETLRRMDDTRGYFQGLNAAVEVPPEHALDRGAWTASAIAGVATRRWKDAQAALDRLKNLDPGFYDGSLGRVLRGAAMSGAGDHKNAIAMLEKTRDVSPPWGFIAAQSLAQSRMETGDLDNAIVEFDRLLAMIARTEGSEPAMTAFALIQKSQCLIRKNRADLALSVLDTVRQVRRSPGRMGDIVDIVEAMSRATALSRLRDHDGALKAIDSAIQKENAAGPGLPRDLIKAGWTLWMRGIILFEGDREEEALRAFEDAQLAGFSGNEALVWQGYALLVLEDPDSARQKFEAAIRDAVARNDVPQHFEALVGKGRAQHRAHTYEAAVATYRDALRVGGSSAEADASYWRRLGEVYYVLERYTASYRAFERGWRMERNANLALGISATLMRQKRHAEALRFLEKEATGLAAKDARLTFNRGVSLWSLGKKNEAKKTIKEASDAGVSEATDVLGSLEPKRDANSGWWDLWFGKDSGAARRAVGYFLLLVVASVLAAPVLAYLKNDLDWKAGVVPAAVALALLLIPSIKGMSLSTEGVKFEIEPSALKGAEELPKFDLLPLGSGVYFGAVSTPARPLELPPPTGTGFH